MLHCHWFLHLIAVWLNRNLVSSIFHRDAIPRPSISPNRYFEETKKFRLRFTAGFEIRLSIHKHIEATTCLHFILVCVYKTFFFVFYILLRLIFHFPVFYGSFKLICIYVAICVSLPARFFSDAKRSRFHGPSADFRDLFAFIYCA